MVQASEPTAVLSVPQTDEGGAPTAAAAAVSTPDAAVESAQVGAASTPQFDFDTDEGIRAALAASERLRGFVDKTKNDGFNAGRQNRDKELRLERGSEDVARAWQEHLADKYGIELDEADRRDSPLWVKANRDAERTTYWRTATETVLDAFDVRERAQIEQALEQFEGHPDQMEQIGRQVVDEAVKRREHARIADLPLAEVPEGSRLWKDIEEYKASEVRKEIEARAQERDTPPPPPNTPVGAAGTGRTQADYARLSPSEIAALPDEEYRIAQGYRG